MSLIFSAVYLFLWGVYYDIIKSILYGMIERRQEKNHSLTDRRVIFWSNRCLNAANAFQKRERRFLARLSLKSKA